MQRIKSFFGFGQQPNYAFADPYNRAALERGQARERERNPIDYSGLSESDQRAAQFMQNIFDRERIDEMVDQRRRDGLNVARVQNAANTSPASKVSATTSPIKSTLTIAGKAGEVFSQSAMAKGAFNGMGSVAGGIGVAGGLLDAGIKGQQLATGTQKKKDKALLAGGLLSDLGSATTSAASMIMQGGKAGLSLFGKASSLAGKVAPIAAMAKGGIDMIGGGIEGGLALHRRKKLQEIEDNDAYNTGMARFAKQGQTTKAVSGLGKMLGGALSIGGGAALLGLGLSNPFGWGLLGGAALVGGGMAAYKKYRKHKIGKQIMNDPAYQAQLGMSGITVPNVADLAPQGKWDKFKNFVSINTESTRAYDFVRGDIADKLSAPHEIWDTSAVNTNGRNEILSNIGQKKTPYFADERTPLEPSLADRDRRMKSIATSLEG